MAREPVKRSDWRVSSMPPQTETFILHRMLTEEDAEHLRMGYAPGSMDEKWFWYCDGNTLYAHRAMSGICVFILEMNPGKAEHKVIMNRAPGEGEGGNAEEDEKLVCELLDWWTDPEEEYWKY